MRKAILIAGGLFLLLLSHNFLFAQALAPIGTVTFIEGVSDITRNNQEPVFVSEREPVYLNDRIRTKSYSKIEITFYDKSVLRLAPNSCATIEEYLLNEQKKREHSRIKLTRGKMEAVVSKTGTPDTFLIETPNARGAVKGSDVFVSYLGSKTGIFVQEGAISVVNPAVPEVKTRVLKGNAVVIPFNQAPGEVRPTRDAEIAYFKRSLEPAFIKKWIPTKGATQMNGTIVSLAGTVRIYKKGAEAWREAKLTDTLSEGDKIQTEERTTVEIRLSNGNTVLVQAYTELSFTTLRYDANSGSYENTLAITTGRISAVVEKVGKQLTFQVTTPTSVAGVRGTLLEVAVIPAAAGAGGQTANTLQPITQVFFEGGSGYVTSLLTGQTQDIGAGQNVVVDSQGSITAPSFTPPEQRNTMFQAWTSAQTMGSYSTVQGATTSEGATLTQVLATPTAFIQDAQVAQQSANLDLQNQEIASSLTFDQLVAPVQSVQNIYQATLDYVGGSGGPLSGTASLSLFDDHTWAAQVSGTYGLWPADSWTIAFSNAAGDALAASGSSPFASETWVADAMSGSVAGMNPGTEQMLLSGTASGTTTAGAPGGGTYSGAASGTWMDMP